MEGLLLDIDVWGPHLTNKKLVSIYFGGGTPALLGASPLAQILEKVRSYTTFQADQIEITLEANPETISAALMREYAQAGVNRVSIGIQSLDDRLLHKLGRTHHATTAIKAIEDTTTAGISNISIDLMYDIPGQTLDAWHHTLQRACELPITHLSLYNLTIEPHTVFFKYRETLRKELPDDECSTRMYQDAIATFEACGLEQYEISAFARHDLYSRHNVGYWTGRPFLGFGPSAFSYWQKKRFRAVANLNRYVQALRSGQSPVDFEEELPPLQQQRELLAIALRLKQGISLSTFEGQYGNLDMETLATLRSLQEKGLIQWNQDHIALTPQGMLFYDTAAVEII